MHIPPTKEAKKYFLKTFSLQPVEVELWMRKNTLLLEKVKHTLAQQLVRDINELGGEVRLDQTGKNTEIQYLLRR